MTNKDKTGTARQQRRRKAEKEWLALHGFTSWEQLHTKLMKDELTINTTLKAELKKVDRQS